MQQPTRRVPSNIVITKKPTVISSRSAFNSDPSDKENRVPSLMVGKDKAGLMIKKPTMMTSNSASSILTSTSSAAVLGAAVTKDGTKKRFVDEKISAKEKRPTKIAKKVTNRPVLRDVSNCDGMNAMIASKEGLKEVKERMEEDLANGIPVTSKINAMKSSALESNDIFKSQPEIVVTDSSELVKAQLSIPKISVVAASTTTTISSHVIVEDSDDDFEDSEDLEDIEASSEELIDIDEDADPTACVEYLSDILKFLKTKEKNKEERIDPGYMVKQKQMTEDIRARTVNFMTGVCVKYNLLSETLLMSVSLMDRFLSRAQVTKSNVQLVGLTCLVISSKYEEVCSPYLQDFIAISDNSFTRDQILKMEDIILRILKWNLGFPNGLHFLRRYSQAAQSDVKAHTLSKYLVELSLASYEVLQFSPSKVAAASVYLARRMLKIKPVWSKLLIHHTEYQESELIACAKSLNKLVQFPVDNVYTTNIKTKYYDSKLLGVSRMPAIAL